MGLSLLDRRECHSLLPGSRRDKTQRLKGEWEMMQKVNQPKPIRVVGLELRTSNEQAFETIPGHWQKVVQQGVLATIPGKTSDDVYAVYTNFENAGKNNQGQYSLIIGAAVEAGSPVPAGLVAAEIPASQRLSFAVESGHPERVGEKWQEIWGKGDLGNTYLADYERYRSNGEIEILVGVK